MIRRSLVARVPVGRGRPKYGLTESGVANAEPLTAQFAQETPLSVRVDTINPGRLRRLPVRRRAKVQAVARPHHHQVPRKLLAALLGGSRTRGELALELGLSEQATGRLLDQAIRDSEVAKLNRSADGPRYCLTVEGRKKLHGVSERLQELARNPTAAPENKRAEQSPPSVPLAKWEWNPELFRPSSWRGIAVAVLVTLILILLLSSWSI
jgi:hypothetical protein